jgi:RHS repeat-associated protein
VGRVPLAYEHPDRVGARFTTFTMDGQARPFDWETYVLPYGAAATDDSTAMHDFTTYLRVGNELDYAVNRFYDRGTARFLQPDSLGSAAFNLSDPQTLNGYAYCGDDPINRTDPFGLIWREVLVYDGSIREGNTIYDFYHWEEIWIDEGSESGDHVPGRGGAAAGTAGMAVIARIRKWAKIAKLLLQLNTGQNPPNLVPEVGPDPPAIVGPPSPPTIVPPVYLDVMPFFFFPGQQRFLSSPWKSVDSHGVPDLG